MSNADFITAPLPAPVSLPPEEISGPRRFFNRELSWLAFNWRVLEEAENPHVPLLERLRFLSISATNLDEFYTVRVAGLRALVRSGNAMLSEDGRTPAEQLTLLHADTAKLMQKQQVVLNVLKGEMELEGISIVAREALTPEDLKFLDTAFLEKVFPVLSPLAIDPAHPFPFIPNAGFCLALELERLSDQRPLQALLPVPQQIPRFISLPAPHGVRRFLPLETLLLLHLGVLFPGYAERGHCAFRVLRDSDLEVEDEAEDLVREFEVALKRRRRGEVIRLKMTANAPKALRTMVMEELGVTEGDVLEFNGLLGMADLRELVLKSRTDLLWPPFTPRVPERVREHHGDLFAAIRKKDILLHHPYESFGLVIDFIEQAARDPNVLAIKQTLYRTSHDSPIVAALCEAAEAGKSVTALVELKARFDEAANIRQSRRLERAGAHVVYGFVHYKTHAKFSSIVRREGENLVTYTHFGTGNYHPITALVYTDLSFFTCDPALGRDATKVFNYLSGYAQPDGLENLAISPISLKSHLLELIEAEANHARAGRPGTIWAKMNSLIEPEIIDALYAASQAGVQISLIVRGICGVRPGIKGLSENIRVKSIVGRFLEHSRSLCFGSGASLPHEGARVFISSADWMGRNLSRRVETLVEILNPTVKEQICAQIMRVNLADRAQSWVLQPSGRYLRESTDPQGEPLFNGHKFFMENPSLSGRGETADNDTPPQTSAPNTQKRRPPARPK